MPELRVHVYGQSDATVSVDISDNSLPGEISSAVVKYLNLRQHQGRVFADGRLLCHNLPLICQCYVEESEYVWDPELIVEVFRVNDKRERTVPCYGSDEVTVLLAHDKPIDHQRLLGADGQILPLSKTLSSILGNSIFRQPSWSVNLEELLTVCLRLINIDLRETIIMDVYVWPTSPLRCLVPNNWEEFSILVEPNFLHPDSDFGGEEIDDGTNISVINRTPPREQAPRQTLRRRRSLEMLCDNSENIPTGLSHQEHLVYQSPRKPIVIEDINEHDLRLFEIPSKTQRDINKEGDLEKVQKIDEKAEEAKEFVPKSSTPKIKGILKRNTNHPENEEIKDIDRKHSQEFKSFESTALSDERRRTITDSSSDDVNAIADDIYNTHGDGSGSDTLSNSSSRFLTLSSDDEFVNNTEETYGSLNDADELKSSKLQEEFMKAPDNYIWEQGSEMKNAELKKDGHSNLDIKLDANRRSGRHEPFVMLNDIPETDENKLKGEDYSGSSGSRTPVNEYDNGSDAEFEITTGNFKPSGSEGDPSTFKPVIDRNRAPIPTSDLHGGEDLHFITAKTENKQHRSDSNVLEKDNDIFRGKSPKDYGHQLSASLLNVQGPSTDRNDTDVSFPSASEEEQTFPRHYDDRHITKRMDNDKKLQTQNSPNEDTERNLTMSELPDISNSQFVLEDDSVYDQNDDKSVFFINAKSRCRNQNDDLENNVCDNEPNANSNMPDERRHRPSQSRFNDGRPFDQSPDADILYMSTLSDKQNNSPQFIHNHDTDDYQRKQPDPQSFIHPATHEPTDETMPSQTTPLSKDRPTSQQDPSLTDDDTTIHAAVTDEGHDTDGTVDNVKKDTRGHDDDQTANNSKPVLKRKVSFSLIPEVIGYDNGTTSVPQVIIENVPDVENEHKLDIDMKEEEERGGVAFEAVRREPRLSNAPATDDGNRNQCQQLTGSDTCDQFANATSVPMEEITDTFSLESHDGVKDSNYIGMNRRLPKDKESDEGICRMRDDVAVEEIIEQRPDSAVECERISAKKESRNKTLPGKGPHGNFETRLHDGTPRKRKTGYSVLSHPYKGDRDLNNRENPTFNEIADTNIGTLGRGLEHFKIQSKTVLDPLDEVIQRCDLQTESRARIGKRPTVRDASKGNEVSKVPKTDYQNSVQEFKHDNPHIVVGNLKASSDNRLTQSHDSLTNASEVSSPRGGYLSDLLSETKESRSLDEVIRACNRHVSGSTLSSRSDKALHEERYLSGSSSYKEKDETDSVCDENVFDASLNHRQDKIPSWETKITLQIPTDNPQRQKMASYSSDGSFPDDVHSSCTSKRSGSSYKDSMSPLCSPSWKDRLERSELDSSLEDLRPRSYRDSISPVCSPRWKDRLERTELNSSLEDLRPSKVPHMDDHSMGEVPAKKPPPSGVQIRVDRLWGLSPFVITVSRPPTVKNIRKAVADYASQKPNQIGLTQRRGFSPGRDVVVEVRTDHDIAASANQHGQTFWWGAVRKWHRYELRDSDPPLFEPGPHQLIVAAHYK